jgi:sugar lactone lactonase YvrE
MEDNHMNLTAFYAVRAAVVAIVLTAGSSFAFAQDDCEPADGATFVCGVYNAEKIISMGNSGWGVASSAAGGPNTLPAFYWIDEAKAAFTAFDRASVTQTPDADAFPNCPAPDHAQLSSLGLAYSDDPGRLYVVNHGGRFSIEVYDVTFGGEIPKLAWVGCVLPPDEHFWPDDVAVLPDGAMIVTSLFDPTDATMVEQLSAGEPHGALGKWSADGGWQELVPGKLSGPNGIVLSPDAQAAFVAEWAGKTLARINLADGMLDTVPLDFLVDNIAWDAQGKALLVGGQAAPVADVFVCAGNADLHCDIPFTLVRIDPKTLAVTPIFGPGKLGMMGTGTGLVQRGAEIWVTAFRSDRIARLAWPQ